LGLFDKIFPNKAKNEKAREVREYFKSMNAYTPAFTTFDGGVYEMELTRAAIHAFATAVSKLKPEFIGSAYQSLGKRMQFKANDFMSTPNFLYRVATILSVNTTAFIIPVYHDDLVTIKGYYPLLPQNAEVMELDGEVWLKYSFPNGDVTAIEWDKVGILTQYQFQNEFFGDGNGPLLNTLALMDMQRQGMMDAIQQAPVIRFMARLNMDLHDDDLKTQRDVFTKQNLSAENKTGVMMFDAKYTDVKQIDSKSYIIDKDQMALIEKNIYNYFGTSEAILQNKFDEDTWNAYYEGKVEPFAIQLGTAMTNMTFTDNEVAHGNQIMFTSSRLQYASNRTKLAVSVQLFDRGVLSTNDVMEIWNKKPVPDGDQRYIRKEYGKVGEGEYASEKHERISESDGLDNDDGFDKTY